MNRVSKAYVSSLSKLMRSHANPSDAEHMAKYMRDQFAFLGIKAPQRKALTRTFIRENGSLGGKDLEDVALALWDLNEREFQYVAFGLLDRVRKKLEIQTVPVLEHLIIHKSWWDTVDSIATHLVGAVFSRFPVEARETLEGWRKSDNFWLRRTTILFQLGYKADTDEDLLWEVIDENIGDEEFFIQKAIGWALREYSKTNPKAVVSYVERNKLASLSQREALKWMKSKGVI